MIKVFKIFFITLLFTSATAFAQHTLGTLKGKVITSDNQPAIGVTVQVTGTRYGALTGANGQYNIKLQPGNYTVDYKALGMLAKQVPVTITAGQTTAQPDIKLEVNAQQLKEVVVTGQYEQRSLKNSVYQVRTITSEQIRLRNATKVQDVLSDQLGFRFTNDLTLGISDVSLMGVAGQGVKVLLDGVPLLDRGESRESINQIDINTIDRIEIVEGPMSVSYGQDAMGGVINMITKKGTGGEALTVNARAHEESAGKKFQGVSGTGSHLASAGINWERKGLQLGGNFTRNNFNAEYIGWKPKDQYMGNAIVGYRTNNMHVWYRFDGEDETINAKGTVNPTENSRTDQNYMSNRWMHQLQADMKLSDRLSLNGAASYTDYTRRTQTTKLDLNTGDRRLTLGAAEQDKATFDTKFLRMTAQYKLSHRVSFQPGVEVNLTRSTGARITGTPQINDYAFFISSEIALTNAISIRPGARFTKNSIYDAPPVTPSLNTKIKLNNVLDLRLAYARGFRAPALRELYFNFFDASHSIRGNENLKAEYSQSFNGSLSWQVIQQTDVRLRSTIGGFYNHFNNQIVMGFDPADASISTYLNLDKAKTAGGTFENTLNYKQLQAKVGFSYTGMSNRYAEDDRSLPAYRWYPEVNTNLMYNFTKLKGNISLFYKLNGTLPSYNAALVGGNLTVTRSERAAFHTADLTLNKQLNKQLTLSGGMKNLFNVTNVANTATNSGGAHSTGGLVPMGYGRSYFLGLTFQYSKY
ncbi:TonB-dependent receptor [Mucilaginibacter myungsuensis]|uniref:TonB-dependent receptor n=1 Tax=Mucilaginibacter myungsuensis TaxID=649104 RepID=A0A929KY73_9SPHI|nr:TonB-dependent receptor [Mucilaginibacter myungsuensis]MBE9662638.1 TonB-dependent receptor [Mucilaginibacter myungsuensis]MDN3598058.1 TonB-dependent receptor [Mucilaginibacter myungsuensis]